MNAMSVKDIGDGLLRMYRQKSAKFLIDVATDDCVFWDNVDAIDKSIEQIRAEFDLHVGQFKHADARSVRLEELSDGFLQQYVVEAKLNCGSKAKDQHVCLIVKLRDARIARIEEYCTAG
ncbi:hypothetical protein [Sphingobium boeckii]|uniref:Ketosteroid isomerase-like protein n=1 Tax=Sphingobium boeckii TaxID=1082345 RepID=A0A7W9EER9_9SPHN|nr:hypothetical protein [Sphingobium boeckii]MBB5684951.1 ketosteroid isomerase-like protein [Sphingobium boeckii]